MSLLARRLMTGVPAGPPVPPLPLAGLMLWLEADTLGLNNNDPVAAWDDLSAENANFTQPTAGKRPVFKTNVVNGLPAVDFTRTSGHVLQAATDKVRVTRPVVLLVMATRDGTLNQHVMTRRNPSSNGFADFEWEFAVRHQSFVTARRLGARWWSGSASDTLLSGLNMTDNAAHLAVWRHHGVGENTIIRQDQTGVASKSTSVAITLAGKSASNRPWMGCERDGDRHLDGWIAAAVVYDDVPMSTLTAAEDYLADKYGL